MIIIRLAGIRGNIGNVMKGNEVLQLSYQIGNKVVQTSYQRGHVGHKTMFKDDFFTFLPKEAKTGLRIPTKYPAIFFFKSDKLANQFKDYLYSKFARFCLSYHKIDQHINPITISVVPYITEDIDYYKYFNLTEEEIDYIESFIK